MDVILKFSKGELKAHLRHTMNTSYPEEAGKVTDKLIKQTHIYIEGYADAMKLSISEPINVKEIREFLLGAAFEYMSKHI